MTQGKSARIALEVIEGIDTDLRYPVQVQLYLHEIRVRCIEKQIDGALSFEFRELEVVVVPGEAQSRAAALCREARDEIDMPPVVVQRAALLRRQPAQGDIPVAERPRRLDQALRGCAYGVDRGMRRRRDKARGIEKALDLCRRMLEVAGKFDLVVTDLRYFLQRAGQVFGHAIAHRVQLDADALKAIAGLGCRRRPAAG